jgi:hypothetical protein
MIADPLAAPSGARLAASRFVGSAVEVEVK